MLVDDRWMITYKRKDNWLKLKCLVKLVVELNDKYKMTLKDIYLICFYINWLELPMIHGCTTHSGRKKRWENSFERVNELSPRVISTVV